MIADARADGTYTFTYNSANRLETVSLGGQLQEQYTYNYLGQLVKEVTETGQVLHYLHDAMGNRVAEYDATSGTPVLLREYIWMDDMPVGVVEQDGSQYGTVYLIRTDHIGRPLFATDTDGNEVWRVSYLPFGGVHTLVGAPIGLGFPGQWFQTESGLYQNWMRDYDPTTGSYLQPDPLGLVDGPNVYRYALANPMRYIDPRGEQQSDWDRPDVFPGPMWPGESYPGELGGSMLDLADRAGGAINNAIKWCFGQIACLVDEEGKYCGGSERCGLIGQTGPYKDPVDGWIKHCTYQCKDGYQFTDELKGRHAVCPQKTDRP